MVIELWQHGNLKTNNMADIDQEIDHNSAFRNLMNDPEYQKMQQDFQKRHDAEVEILSNDMTADMLADIRDWRCGTGPDDPNTHSWRGVAAQFYEKYPEFSYSHSIISSNQISGMMLCQVAQELLKQDNSEGWN
jgi:hypothetical protein